MTERLPGRRGIDPPPDLMRTLGYQVVDWIVDRLSELDQAPVANLDGLEVLLKELDEQLPTEGAAFDGSLQFLAERVVPRMTKVNHPRFHAYIPGPGSYYGALGDFIASSLNPFLGSSLGGASFAALELLTLRWVAEAVGYPSAASGIFTSGGSLANLGALAAARRTTRAWRLAKVYVSEQGHASMDKAALVLGFDADQIVRLPTRDDYTLDPVVARDHMRRDRAAGHVPLFLCANAGTTNTGSVDPLAELADVCTAEDVWFHVDAAYGGFAAITERGRTLLEGMERADSLTLDPHKWLYTPIGCGCLLVNRPDALDGAFPTTGDYLKDVAATEINFFDRGPELSRRARAVPVWLLIRSVGMDELRRQIDLDLDLAEVAERLLAAAAAFEIVHRSLSVVSFRLVARPGESEAARTRREYSLVQSLLAGGDVLVSSTMLNGRSALRLVVLNHRTDEAELRRSVAALSAAAATT